MSNQSRIDWFLRYCTLTGKLRPDLKQEIDAIYARTIEAIEESGQTEHEINLAAAEIDDLMDY